MLPLVNKASRYGGEARRKQRIILIVCFRDNILRPFIAHFLKGTCISNLTARRLKRLPLRDVNQDWRWALSESEYREVKETKGHGCPFLRKPTSSPDGMGLIKCLPYQKIRPLNCYLLTTLRPFSQFLFVQPHAN